MTVERAIRTWRAGVIAAGWGERLRRDSPTLKPLVSIRGQTLVERVLLSVAEASPSEVVIIVNEAAQAVKDHVASRRWPFAIRWIVETTESSMHSFLRVVETLAAEGDDGPFLISTVDTIARPGSFAAFTSASDRLDVDVALAIAPQRRDDDKPLLVRVGADGATVTAIGSATREVRLKPDTTDDRTVWLKPDTTYEGRVRLKPDTTCEGYDGASATAGYYAVRSSVLREASAARRERLPALRNFFERLLERGYRMAAVPVDGGVDVDTPSDVRAAETFLEQVER